MTKPISLEGEGAFSPEKGGVSLYSDADKRMAFLPDLFQTAPTLSPLVAVVGGRNFNKIVVETVSFEAHCRTGC